jgi:hypothetical protein
MALQASALLYAIHQLLCCDIKRMLHPSAAGYTGAAG